MVTRRRRLERPRQLMAIAADHRLMTAREWEPGVLVLCQAECGRLEPLQIVASFAAVETGRTGKLAGVRIFMAIDAVLKPDVVKRRAALRNVTLGAAQCGVLSQQWIGGSCVFLHAESRWLESVDGVTGRAFSRIRPPGELPAVRIRLVAIHTLPEDERFLEIPSFVTLHTLHRGVLAEQGEFCPGMVEGFLKREAHDPFPVRGAVAGFTSLRKTAAMRVAVAVLTLGEGDSGIARLSVAPCGVAFLAGHLNM